MDGHVLWHLLVLGTTLLAAAGGAIVLLAPLAFDQPPEGLQRAKPYIAVVVVAAVLLICLEWLAIH